MLGRAVQYSTMDTIQCHNTLRRSVCAAVLPSCLYPLSWLRFSFLLFSPVFRVFVSLFSVQSEQQRTDSFILPSLNLLQVLVIMVMFAYEIKKIISIVNKSFNFVAPHINLNHYTKRNHLNILKHRLKDRKAPKANTTAVNHMDVSTI